jgi:hypothetical protein
MTVLWAICRISIALLGSLAADEQAASRAAQRLAIALDAASGNTLSARTDASPSLAGAERSHWKRVFADPRLLNDLPPPDI